MPQPPPGPPGPGRQPQHGGRAEGQADPGVFGAPFEPQPGVYGQPPAGPYGQPPSAPYGRPADAPHGQPAPNTPYGYPQPFPQRPAQPLSGGPAGPGRGRRARGRTGGIVAAVLAGVLVVGAGVWYAVGDGGDGAEKPVAGATSGASAAPKEPAAPPGGTATPDPAPADLNAAREAGEGKVLWLQKNTVDVPGNGVSQFGPWFAGNIVAKALYRTVSGHSVADGAQKWSVRLRTDICSVPTLPSPDGKIVLGLRSDTTGDGQCDRLQMVDLRTGTEGWSAQVDRPGSRDKLSHVNLAVNGDVLTVGRTSRTDAYRIGDGKHLWDELPGDCQPYGFASGAVPLAATSCRGTGDYAVHHVRRIDPATGKEQWAYRVEEGYRVDKFYATDPPVVSLRDDEQDRWMVVSLDADGTYRSRLTGDGGGTAVTGDDHTPRCEGELPGLSSNLDGCMGIAADASTLYLATRPVSEDMGSLTNTVVAYDLATGKSRWKTEAPAGQTLMPLRVEAGRVLMYLNALRTKDTARGGGIYALPPTGGALQPVLRHPASASEVESGFSTKLVAYSGGRTVFLQTYIGGGDDEQEKSILSMLAFGD